MGLMGLMSLMGLMGCEEASREDKAKEAAQEYYQALLNGDYQAFLDGRAHMDSIPDSFREQLLVAFKQFMHQQQEAQDEAERAAQGYIRGASYYGGLGHD